MKKILAAILLILAIGAEIQAITAVGSGRRAGRRSARRSDRRDDYQGSNYQ